MIENRSLMRVAARFFKDDISLFRSSTMRAAAAARTSACRLAPFSMADFGDDANMFGRR